MRCCGSFQVVELMRQGLSPQEACLEAIRRITRKDPKGTGVSVGFVALDRKGRYGAAVSAQGFPFAVTTKSGRRVLSPPGIGQPDFCPEGGNRR